MQPETPGNGSEAGLARAGELTLASAQQLRAELLQCLERGGSVVLDLREVTEIDLACLQVLAAAGRSAGAKGKALRILTAPALEQAWRESGFPHGG